MEQLDLSHINEPKFQPFEPHTFPTSRLSTFCPSLDGMFGKLGTKFEQVWMEQILLSLSLSLTQF